MKRLLPLLLAVLLTGVPVPALLWAQEKPVPYQPDEFNPVLRGLRRSEIIFFGSIPITFLLSGLGWEIGQAAAGNAYSFSNEQHTYNILFTAGALSLSIVLIDLVIGLLED